MYIPQVACLHKFCFPSQDQHSSSSFNHVCPHIHLWFFIMWFAERYCKSAAPLPLPVSNPSIPSPSSFSSLNHVDRRLDLWTCETSRTVVVRTAPSLFSVVSWPRAPRISIQASVSPCAKSDRTSPWPYPTPKPCRMSLGSNDSL